MRTFALDRMTDLQVTGESFKIPADSSVEEYLAGSLAIERGEPRKVVIEFDGIAALVHATSIPAIRPSGRNSSALRAMEISANERHEPARGEASLNGSQQVRNGLRRLT